MDIELWKKIDEEEPIPAHIQEKMAELKAKGKILPEEKYIKRPTMIEGMRKAGKINTAVLDEVGKYIHVGMNTQEIDDIVSKFTKEHGAICAPLHYDGFPKSVCTSINEEVCHGIPTRLKNADASRMFYVGNVSEERKRLVEETKKCLELGIAAAQPWNTIGDIGYAINNHARSCGYSVVVDLGGHGVGLEFHEDPFVSHVGRKGEGMVLVPGMTITIEPMINAGRASVVIDPINDWTIYTKDKSDSAQWEHTILITEEGNEIITY